MRRVVAGGRGNGVRRRRHVRWGCGEGARVEGESSRVRGEAEGVEAVPVERRQGEGEAGGGSRRWSIGRTRVDTPVPTGRG